LTATSLQLISDGALVNPVLDAALSHALLVGVAAGELPETLRISRPGPAVAFGKRDVVSDGYGVAVDAVRSAGFEAVERLAGGRASAFHDGTLHFGHAVRDPDPRAGVTARFEQTAALVAQAFGRLGIDARVGEIPGEYCPGEHSVNARGAVKLMGLGQRVIGGGAYLGGVIVVDGAERIRDVLAPVYEALALDWDPDTTGSLAAERPGTSWSDVAAALEAEYGERYALQPAELDAATATLADSLTAEHRSPQ